MRLIIPVLSQQLSVSYTASVFNYIGTVSVFISLCRSGCARLQIADDASRPLTLCLIETVSSFNPITEKGLVEFPAKQEKQK